MTAPMLCTSCRAEIHDDELADWDNEICEACNDAWMAEQEAYWRPLYEGEKVAGLLPPEHYK